MTKFEITYSELYNVTYTVEANSLEEAEDLAHDYNLDDSNIPDGVKGELIFLESDWIASEKGGV